MAREISKTQVSYPGPSWPSCFELLPFVNFHFEFLSGSLLPKCKRFQLEISQTDNTQVSSNYSPGVKFDPTPRVTSLT